MDGVNVNQLSRFFSFFLSFLKDELKNGIAAIDGEELSQIT